MQKDPLYRSRQKCITDGRTDRQMGQMERQTDRKTKGLILQDPSQRWRSNDVFWKFKKKILHYVFLIIIVSHMKRINARKRNTIIHSTAFKEFKKKKKSLANLCKITFTLFECHRSTAKFIDFYFFLLSLQSSQ